jgi:transcriptional regulator with XRE-family HTH domain
MSTRQRKTSASPGDVQITLGSFLRARRERLSPSQAKIKALARRRTPGLRREEVAQLAGISPEWYTYLEQDRDVRPSSEAIERIATALQLTWAEREYLCELAFPRSYRGAPKSALPASLQRFMDELEYRPAYVVNDLWDIVGWNAAAFSVFPGLQAGARPNLMISVFLDPAWRCLHKHWERNARRMLALFRLTVAAHAGHERCVSLLAQLNASSEEFARWWREQGVLASSSGPKELDHPRVGELSLDYTSFRTTDDSSITMIAFMPRDSSTRKKLQRLLDC